MTDLDKLFEVEEVIPPELMWTQEEAVKLCRDIEAFAPEFGAHVALTGGSLYKDGLRKDADILFYRIRQVEKIDEEGLLDAIEKRLGVIVCVNYGWVYKAELNDKGIDFFFPERANEEEDNYGR